jgi:hypothetical protein
MEAGEFRLFVKRKPVKNLLKIIMVERAFGLRRITFWTIDSNQATIAISCCERTATERKN